MFLPLTELVPALPELCCILFVSPSVLSLRSGRIWWTPSPEQAEVGYDLSFFVSPTSVLCSLVCFLCARTDKCCLPSQWPLFSSHVVCSLWFCKSTTKACRSETVTPKCACLSRLFNFGVWINCCALCLFGFLFQLHRLHRLAGDDFRCFLCFVEFTCRM